ncbi:tRNA (guanine(9)-N(1))-methyltransferase [Saxophila tyrrhenica]|uniref:tRNA (guanine(9)-N1)-methyltransferase n=1 Tax=Saxophila tyrrhenica TaxID=1690608 RepID=A0AAV9PK55_9PEZI|nr:tRNA (guanine(9)-N(1))-methyltransferase [Saxophila tyrrhenica]
MEAEERPMKRRRLSEEEKRSGDVVQPDSQPTTNFISPDDGAKEALQDIKADEHANGSDVQKSGAVASDKLVLSENEKLPLPAASIPGSLDKPDDPPMSKNQMKKLLKKQEWEAKREDRKAFRKEKNVAKRERRREERKQQHQEAVDSGRQLTPQPLVQKTKRQRPVTLPTTILFDCDFDDLMRDNERVSLAAQITRSYSDNRKSMFRAHLAVCSFNGKLRERFDTILTHYKGWKAMRFLDCDFVEAAEKAKEWMADDQHGGRLAGTFSTLVPDKEDSGEDSKQDHGEAIAKLKDAGEIVYLTSESEHTLTELKPYSTYIIGGLVDKNREKGICYKRAKQKGIKTARLPIGEFMEMQSRKVLATNHVNEIMVKWLECGDWAEAFMKAIPARKGGKLKGGQDEDDAAEHDQGGAEGDDDAEDQDDGVEIAEEEADGSVGPSVLGDEPQSHGNNEAS